MIVKLFAVLDEKAGVFTSPFAAIAPGMAIRMFEDECRNPQNPWSRHPADYRLYEVGSYDDSCGFVSAVVPATYLVSGAEVLAVASKPAMVRDA